MGAELEYNDILIGVLIGVSQLHTILSFCPNNIASSFRDKLMNEGKVLCNRSRRALGQFILQTVRMLSLQV